eukprot:354175-Chlamydomonas_euryale.AAC.1
MWCAEPAPPGRVGHAPRSLAASGDEGTRRIRRCVWPAELGHPDAVRRRVSAVHAGEDGI